ncbi:hypothetical protein IWX49DRAFT_571083 [Phyllosticta citricarpa]
MLLPGGCGGKWMLLARTMAGPLHYSLLQSLCCASVSFACSLPWTVRWRKRIGHTLNVNAIDSTRASRFDSSALECSPCINCRVEECSLSAHLTCVSYAGFLVQSRTCGALIDCVVCFGVSSLMLGAKLWALRNGAGF